MSSRESIPAAVTSTAETVSYHQTHTVYGLPACPLCGWRSLIVRSYGKSRDGRSYYVTCEHCSNTEDAGSIEGPVKSSAADAGKAFHESMRKFAESFMRGDGGEY
jgi:predicted RNA-binding Zn-ribbon protein involved in translation (DUF1610 family)